MDTEKPKPEPFEDYPSDIYHHRPRGRGFYAETVTHYAPDPEATTGDNEVKAIPGPIERIQEALSGKRGGDQERIAKEGIAWVDLLLRKNRDYGSSAWKSPVVAPNLNAATAILVRMSDKIERITSLTAKDAPEVAESLDDTIRDLGAYCLLYLARPMGDETPLAD